MGYEAREIVLLDDNHGEDEGWEDDGDVIALSTFPPGEEAALMSHAGGEATYQVQITDLLGERR